MLNPTCQLCQGTCGLDFFIAKCDYIFTGRACSEDHVEK